MYIKFALPSANSRKHYKILINWHIIANDQIHNIFIKNFKEQLEHIILVLRSLAGHASLSMGTVNEKYPWTTSFRRFSSFQSWDFIFELYEQTLKTWIALLRQFMDNTHEFTQFREQCYPLAQVILVKHQSFVSKLDRIVSFHMLLSGSFVHADKRICYTAFEILLLFKL